ncbi:MAG: hypothetical protein FJ399_24715 [Verrucomicrobia bacterium]|nr:hypothetical protein [Verrucomicrobiota bacterium]
MAPDAGMAVGVGLAILCVLIVPALAMVLIVWRVAKARGWPRWVPLAAFPLGILLGIVITFFVVFDDLGEQYLAKRAAPTIEVQIPQGYRGTVLVYFSDSEPPLQPIAPKRYRVEVPITGSLLTGSYAERQRVYLYVHYALSYPNGERPPQATPSLGGGTFNDVSFERFFIGSADEYRADSEARHAKGTLFNEREILESLRAARAARKP